MRERVIADAMTLGRRALSKFHPLARREMHPEDEE